MKATFNISHIETIKGAVEFIGGDAREEGKAAFDRVTGEYEQSPHSEQSTPLRIDNTPV